MRMSNRLYGWAGLAEDPWKLLCAWQRLFPEAVFAGSTAAWLFRIATCDPIPIEVIMSQRSGVRSRPGLIVHRSKMPASDVVFVRGVRATRPMRTLSDVCRRLSGVEALVVIDASLHLKLIDKSALLDAASPRLRHFGPLAEAAESPMETRLRWLLVQAGLPRPQVQAPLSDAHSRADLYYPDARLVIEFDGGNHRDRLVEDNCRQNLLMSAGYKVLRFTASDIYDRQPTIVAQVRQALSAGAAISARRPAAAPR